MAVIALQELNADNWRECARLQVSEEQKGSFSSNLYRIAQSRFDPSLILCAVYNERGVMVGFLVYSHRYKPGGMPQEPEGYWSLVHLMIDKNYQGKGYGRAAVEEVIKRVKESGMGKMLSLSYALENLTAKRLYESLGFRESGEMNGNESVARLQLMD